jgi:hypothetical protein
MSSSLALKKTAVPHMEFSLTGAATYILFKKVISNTKIFEKLKRM